MNDKRLKIVFMHRANWLNNNKGQYKNIATGAMEDKPCGYSDIKEVRELQEARDKYLMAYDLEPAMELQLKINELLGKEEY